MKKLLTVFTIAYALLAGCATKAQINSISVKSTKEDTTNPVITLVSDSVTVETGAKYSAKDNIKSVTDDTDGTLEYAEKAADDSAYYLINDSKLDTSKVGTYKVTVTACDKSGNTAMKYFNVVVKDADKKDASKQSDTTKSNKTETDSAKSDATTVAKASTSSSSSSNTSQSKSSNTPSNSSTSSNNSSNSSNGGSSTSSVSSSSQTNTTTNSQSAHEHSWVTITETRHHDEAGHWDKEAQYGILNICRGCGKVFYSDAEVTAHIASVTQEQFLAGCGAMKQETGIVGYTDVWKVDKEAYDESVITGYKCSTCGATK